MGNSSTAIRCLPETERTLAFGGISAVYAAVGAPLDHPAIALVFDNQTDAPVSFSWDGTNATRTCAAGTTYTFDVQTNRSDRGEMMQVAQGTQFWVRQISAPSLGSVYISVFYGANFNNL